MFWKPFLISATVDLIKANAFAFNIFSIILEFKRFDILRKIYEVF